VHFYMHDSFCILGSFTGGGRGGVYWCILRYLMIAPETLDSHASSAFQGTFIKNINLEGTRICERGRFPAVSK